MIRRIQAVTGEPHVKGVRPLLDRVTPRSNHVARTRPGPGSAFVPGMAIQHIAAARDLDSREAHSGPHADWFWRKELSGGGALLDMGCHTIEAARYFIGKDNPVVEVVAWTCAVQNAK